jgi:hypothetical protein
LRHDREPRENGEGGRDRAEQGSDSDQPRRHKRKDLGEQARRHADHGCRQPDCPPAGMVGWHEPIDRSHSNRHGQCGDQGIEQAETAQVKRQPGIIQPGQHE